MVGLGVGYVWLPPWGSTVALGVGYVWLGSQFLGPYGWDPLVAKKNTLFTKLKTKNIRSMTRFRFIRNIFQN